MASRDAARILLRELETQGALELAWRGSGGAQFWRLIGAVSERSEPAPKFEPLLAIFGYEAKLPPREYVRRVKLGISLRAGE